MRRVLVSRKQQARRNLVNRLKRNYDLYLLLLLPLTYFFIFKYIPMYGMQIAFKNFSPRKGIIGSPWAGFKYFNIFFNSYFCGMIIKNTLIISFYTLLVGFPIPILLALSINEVQNANLKKAVQTITYMPHFLSVIVVCSMVIQFLSPSTGIINKLIVALGGQPYYFMQDPNAFPHIYVISGVWQEMGWGAIIYLATLSGVDASLYEAATIDGATRMQKLVHINIPFLLPTVVTMLILRTGSIMNIGFEKVLLLQNSLNYDTSEVISTYVYNKGILGAQYSFSTAVGLFNNVINFALLLLVNAISRRVSENGLW